MARGRYAECIAQDAHRPDIPLIFDHAEPHLGASEKSATAFPEMSRSWRGRSFSRRSREISAARSATQGMADAGFAGTADPACCPPWRLPQLRSIEGDRLRLELICKMTPFLAHSTPFRSSRSLRKVSTNPGEA